MLHFVICFHHTDEYFSKPLASIPITQEKAESKFKCGKKKHHTVNTSGLIQLENAVANSLS